MLLTIRPSSVLMSCAVLITADPAWPQDQERPPLMPKAEQESSLVDRVVAQVEGEAILLSDVQMFAQAIMSDQQRRRTEGQLTEALMQQALDQLITQKVLLAQALDDSVEIEEGELDQVIEERKQQMIQQFGSEKGAEDALGYSLRDLAKIYRPEIRKDMLAERIRALKFQNMSITRREVEEFFRTQRDSLPQSPERYKIRHILRRLQPGPEAYAAAEQAITIIQDRLQAGGDFPTVARDFSEDPGSARLGGDLGWFERGEMVAEFEAVAFRMQPGERSEVIRTEYGFHIIEVQEREGERIRARHILRSAKPTDGDKRRVAEYLMELKRRAEAGEDFGDLAREFSEGTDDAAQGGDLGWFSARDLAVPEFLDVINRLETGGISAPFETRFGIHIIWLEDKSQSHALSLDDDYQTVESMALQRKQVEEFNRWLADIRRDFYIEFKEEL